MFLEGACLSLKENFMNDSYRSNYMRQKTKKFTYRSQNLAYQNLLILKAESYKWRIKKSQLIRLKIEKKS